MNFSCSPLFHMKTRTCLKYFVNFCHDHTSSIRKMKEIYPKIIPNSFKFEPINKGDIKMKYRNSI